MAIQDELKRPKTKEYEKDNFGNKAIKKKTFKEKWVPGKNDSAGEIAGKIISIVALAVLVVSLAVLIYYFWESKTAKDNYNKIQDSYDNLMTGVTDVDDNKNTSDDNSPLPILPSAQELLKINSETVGWISLPNTKIKYPVVMRKTSDDGNTYYLDHMFDGSKNRAGAVFADYRTTIEDRKQSDNIVLYGHNEKDNTMFGDLDLYKKPNNGFTTKADINYYRTNPVFEFNTNYQTGKYKIFAMFVTTTLKETDASYEVFDYQNYIDFDKARYDSFISKINARNMIKTDIDVQYGDKFVTLSTCSSEITDSRFVVIGRKIRPGEGEAVNVEKAVLNENYIEPNWAAIFKNYQATLPETTSEETSDVSEIFDNDYTDNSSDTFIDENTEPVTDYSSQTSSVQDTGEPYYGDDTSAETEPIAQDTVTEDTEQSVIFIEGMEDLE